MKIEIYIYFDKDQKESAKRKAKKYVKNENYTITEETNNCITLKK